MSSYSDNSDSAASATPVSGGRNVADLKIDVLRLVGPCCSSLQSGDFSFFFLTPPLVTPRLSSSPRPLPPSPSSAHRQLTDAENPCTVDEVIAELQVLDSEVKRKTIVEWLRNWKTGTLQFLVDIRRPAASPRRRPPPPRRGGEGRPPRRGGRRSLDCGAP